MWIRRSSWLWRKTWRGAKQRCYGRQETSPARRFACFTSIVPARPASCSENLLFLFLSDLTVLW
ncbi:unnamed protein product [Brassica napus]|uniref:(rape) hypothetical protein n=1 Tax=Brassica napus TaxID=3708 RepID=A0A816SH72_BRANA|nr:unnamed protein product [Brassica napus]